MANLENEAAQGLLALENSSTPHSHRARQAVQGLLALHNPHTPHLHSAQRATQRAAQSTLLAQEAARRARESRLAVHRHNAAAKLQAATRGRTVRRRSWRPKGISGRFTIGVAPSSGETRRKKKHNKSKGFRSLPKYVSTGLTKRRRTMGGKYKPRRKKSKSKKR